MRAVDLLNQCRIKYQ